MKHLFNNEIEIEIDDIIMKKYEERLCIPLMDSAIIVYVDNVFDLPDEKSVIEKIKKMDAKELSRIVTDGMKDHIFIERTIFEDA